MTASQPHSHTASGAAMPAQTRPAMSRRSWSIADNARLRRLVGQGYQLRQLKQAFPDRTTKAIQSRLIREGLSLTRGRHGAILRAHAKGHSPAQIARDLQITEHTVRKFLRGVTA
ncbi:MAG: hypothetical protein Alpg2KO_01240 [Alphaproteobacteria bacterium]